MWNTENRNGVLIYVLLADRNVEIVADRGAVERIGQADWEGVCRLMEGHFGDGRFARGRRGGGSGRGRIVSAAFSATRPQS